MPPLRCFREQAEVAAEAYSKWRSQWRRAVRGQQPENIEFDLGILYMSWQDLGEARRLYGLAAAQIKSFNPLFLFFSTD